MAKHSTEQDIQEHKELRAQLSQLDDQISLPASLQGDALLHKLEGVKQDPQTEIRISRSQFLSWKTLKVLVSSAAIFAVVLATARSLPFHLLDTSMPKGGIAISYTDAEAPATEEGPADTVQETPEAFAADSTPETALDTVENPTAPTDSASIPAASSIPQDPALPADSVASSATETSEGTAPEEASPLRGMPGVGGGGPSTTLANWGNYRITWRTNDASDPDKGAFPVSVEVIDSTTEVLHQELNLAEIKRVDQLIPFGDSLFLIGSDGSSTSLYSYRETQEGEIVRDKLFLQPGETLLVQTEGEAIYFASRGTSFSDEWDSVALPSSTPTEHIYLSAYDMNTDAVSQLSLQAPAQYTVTQQNSGFAVEYTTTEDEQASVFVTYAYGSLDMW